jgi:hypothetical protein|tara:strand:+ start:191 stop:841 length:651 start_codon:yes stop_codon:yes gene_type:complete
MNDLETLARTIYGEAETNDREDAVAIANVILNRTDLPNWPDTVAAVCMQSWQFSCWNADNPRRQHLLEVKVADSPQYSMCVDVATEVMNGTDDDPTSRSTHYYATYIKAPRWAKGKVPVYETPSGRYNHLFFNDIDTPPPETAKESLDQERPLNSTRTMVGGQVAVGAQVLNEVAQNIQPLVAYSEAIKWVFIGVTLIGIGMMVWARIDDRRKGRR